MFGRVSKQVGRWVFAIAMVLIVCLVRGLEKLGFAGVENEEQEDMRYAQQKAHAVVNGYEWGGDEDA